MTGPHVDTRAVTALAEAIDAAVDTWDTGRLPPWATADPDRRALAEAIISILSQHGYSLARLPAAGPEDPGYGLEVRRGDRDGA